MRGQRMRVGVLVGVVLLLGGREGWCQTPPRGADGPPNAVAAAETFESLERKLTELETAQLDDAAKARARDYYQQARQELDQQAAWDQQAAEYTRRAATAADRLLEQVRRENARTRPPTALAPPENAELSDLERVLAEREAEQRRLNELLKQLDAEPQRRANRRLEVPPALAELQQQIAELKEQLGSPGEPNEVAAVSVARRTLLASRWQARRAQATALEAELQAYEAEKDLPTRERTFHRSRLAEITQEVERYTQLVNARRQDEVEQRHQRVRRQLEQATAAVRDQAEASLRLSNEARELTQKLAREKAMLAQLKEELESWRERAERTQSRLEKGGGAVVVFALRNDRAAASDRLTQLGADLVQRSQTIADIQDRQIELQDEDDEYANLDKKANTISRQKGFGRAPEEEGALRDELRVLLQTHRELLDDLVSRNSQYFDLLVELNETSQDLVRTIRQYRDFIDARILWMRSTEVLSWSALVHAMRSSLLASQDWQATARRVGGTLWRDLRSHFLLTSLGTLVFATLVYYQRRLRRRLTQLGENAHKGNCTSFVLTLRSLLLTVLISLPWSLALAYVGWRLTRAVPSWGQGVLGAAAVYFPLELFRQVCRRRGLGEAHFGWSERILATLRVHLRWFALTAVPLTLVACAAYVRESDATAMTLGQVAFILLALLTSLLLQRILHPHHGVLQEYLAFHRGGWADQLRFVWYPAACLLPLAAGLLAAVGFYYTAVHLALRFYYTALALFAIVVLSGLLNRLLLVNRRALAMRQARERHQRRLEHGESEAPKTADDTSLDLAAINAQTRRLIRASIALAVFIAAWVVWSDVLPALAIFDRVTLYRTEGLEPGVIVPITLTNLGIALIVLMMTSIAARNLPGLIEIVLLQRLPLDSSVRYAITTVGRYLIVLAGLVVVSSTLGLSWKRAQWLVAALGVGLGFGLQEIFANLVSGVILLFERPIRVGDTVTLGDVTGEITRIRIRATTLRDWDGKELIVPNKELVTSRLLNWTLSDSSVRITIRVGVAYGSDVVQATSLMMQVAQAHPLISPTPAPTVTFESFGESSLLLVLRAFVPRLDIRLRCIHDLHLAIAERFRQAGIEIAFPQLDLHVRSGGLALAPPDARAGDEAPLAR